MTPQLTTPDGTPVSRFCFGTMQFGGKADEAGSRALYDACRAAGINLFDTAHAYTDGRSETFLGRFAAAERDRVFITSKANFSRGSGAANIRASIVESLARMGTAQVDLYYLHRWDGDTPLEETFEALAREVDAGRIRHVGVSNFAAWQVMKAQAVAEAFDLRIAAFQPMYNLVKRQAEVEILPMAQSEGIAVLPYSPLGGGLLSGKYASGEAGRLTEDRMYAGRYAPDWMHRAAADLSALAAEVGAHPATLAVAWVARNPGVTGPIISARTVEQLQPSLDALAFEMDDALHDRISALTPKPPPATDRLEEA